MTRPGRRAGRRRTRGGPSRSGGRGGTRRDRRTSRRRGWPTPGRTPPCTPPGIVMPATVGAVRAVAHQHVDRRIVAQRLLDRRRARARGRRAGASSSAGSAHTISSMLPMRWRVVSLPAMSRNASCVRISRSVRRCPSTSVCSRRVTKSSGGSAAVAALGDHPVEVGGELGRDAGQALAVVAVLSPVLRGVGALHDDVGPLGEPVVVGGVGAEQVRDHRGRDRRDVLGHQIAATPLEQPVEQLGCTGRGRRARPGRCGAGRSPS